MTVSEVRRPHGAVMLTSAQYTGGATVTIKHPALILTVAPAGPPCVRASRIAAIESAALASGKPRQICCGGPRLRRQRILVLIIGLRKATLPNFSGKVPAGVLRAVNAHGGVPPGELLRVTLASVTTSRSHHHRSITARPYLQLGILLNPGPF